MRYLFILSGWNSFSRSPKHIPSMCCVEQRGVLRIICWVQNFDDGWFSTNLLIRYWWFSNTFQLREHYSRFFQTLFMNGGKHGYQIYASRLLRSISESFWITDAFTLFGCDIACWILHKKKKYGKYRKYVNQANFGVICVCFVITSWSTFCLQ